MVLFLLGASVHFRVCSVQRNVPIGGQVNAGGDDVWDGTVTSLTRKSMKR